MLVCGKACVHVMIFIVPHLSQETFKSFFGIGNENRRVFFGHIIVDLPKKCLAP